MNLTRIVSTDNLRPSLSVAVLMNGYIYATNGHILIKIKADSVFKVETDNKVLDLDLLKSISKAGKTSEVFFNEDCVQITNRNGTRFYPYSGTIEKNGEMNMSKFSCSWDAHGCNYPDIESVLNVKERELFNAVGLNPALLNDLRLGFAGDSSNGVKLTFTKKSNHIIVEPEQNPIEQYGVIMPLNISE